MSEKSYSNSNDTDATLVNSADFNHDSALNPKQSTASSSTQYASEDTLPMMRSHYDVSPLAEIQLELGSVIKDTFELVAVLGEGGMGTVFKALNKVWQEVEARDPYVAIKVLKPELSANKQLVRSLYSDFDRTKMLANCPNIIKVQGFDRDGPHLYMTMEYLSGKTLGEYINSTPMSLSRAWFIIEGIGNALAYAHENNIVHRDIKPGNIMITHDNIVKVLDFGIASKINENEGDETKFGGHELGALTVAYASPEMQRDYPPDARDDIFAFACVIYEILTGKQFYKQKTHKASLIQGLNSRQMETLNKALAFERDQRTGSIHELLDKLRPVKIPWVKYSSIGGGGLAIVGLVLWWIMDSVTSPELKQISPSEPVPATAVTQPLPQTSSPALVSAPVLPQEPVPVMAPIPELTPINTEPSYSSTSSDGTVHLQTSKPEYKNGQPFQLSFVLTQPMYVRVIDRDAKGEVTTLRPNPRQQDKLLVANQEHSFPPEGFNVPVKGPSGNGSVTVVASLQPFPKAVEFLNDDGSVSEQVRNGSYSWTQVRYILH